jgi:hypothetical protein
MGNAIIRKWSDQTYPGFEEFKNYVESCDILSYRNDEVHRNDSDSCIWFKDASGRASADMEYILNVAKFRHFHNLMPAGTDPAIGFCQLMVLKYRSKLNLNNESGTYLMRFHVWTDIYTNKNEAQYSQKVNFSYSASNKEYYNMIVCL